MFLIFLVATHVAPDAFTGPADVAGSSRRCSIHVAQEEDVAMRIYGLSPFWRSIVGFEKMKPPRIAIQFAGNGNQQTGQKQAT